MRLMASPALRIWVTLLSTCALEVWISDGAGQPLPLHVPGVPFYVFNQRKALSGAQPPEVLLEAMRQVCAVAQTEPAL